MRSPVLLIALCCLCGCEDFNNAMEMDNSRAPVAPGGVATAQDIDDLAGTNRTAPQASQQPAANAQPARPNKGIIGKTTAQIVDAQLWKQKPKIVEVENKIQGNDPITVAASAYVSMTSKASSLGFTQALQHHKALNGKPATYAEFMTIVKQNRAEFAMLPPYQMYGYDSESGGIVILEDKADKIRRYKEKDIPLDPGDEQYQ